MRLVYTFLFMLLSLNISAQADTLQLKLEDIVITATKTKRQLSSVTVPVTLIPSREIAQLNAHRLQDVLGEYTGLNVTSSALGAGIQMQGLDPEYTLIMIDGLPLIGRLNGVLDLSRLSVMDIEQIEVVKGPSSALFGSNALAGVVNIITKKPKAGLQSNSTVKYSSFNTLDLSSQLAGTYKKYQGSLSANYYTTGGYDLSSNYQGYNVSTDYYGKTVSPHDNYAFNMHNSFQLNKYFDIKLDGRLFKENEIYKFADAQKNIVNGKGFIKDYALTPMVVFKLSPKFKSTLKYTHNNYQTETTEKFSDEKIYSQSRYQEKYNLLEVQNDFHLNKNHEFNIGLGYEKESLKTTRLAADKTFPASNKYIYAQYIYSRSKKADFVVGARFENHENYKPQLNPRASIRYEIIPKLTLRASIGRGFKKPDFKQLFFNYTNSAIGYSVFGVKFLGEGIEGLKAKGEIAQDPDNQSYIVYPELEEILNANGKLKAESSIGSNFSLQYAGFKNTRIDINLFRNDLKNLIDITPVALKTNGWRAYSYLNKRRVFTQGMEIDIKYFINKNIKISGGYQYLIAKDKDVIDEIKAGRIFAKDLETGSSYKLKTNQYGGLLNRANHSGNFKIFVSNFWQHTTANLRVLYNGRFGYTDLNNNQLLDIDQEYIPAYFLVNTSIQKEILDKKLIFQLGVDNLFNYTYATPEYTISSLPGRIFFSSITFKLNTK